MEVGDQHHAPAALSPGKTRYPLCRRLGGPQGRSGRVRKSRAPTGIRSPDRPTRSESLYRLCFSGSHINSHANSITLIHLSVCTVHIYWCTGQTHQTWERGSVISWLTEIVRRSQWPRVLRHGSVAACLLGLRLRVPLGAWLSFVREVSASGWSVVKRSSTECGVSECNREASILKGPLPTWGSCATK
jgi:hypothetical protein